VAAGTAAAGMAAADDTGAVAGMRMALARAGGGITAPGTGFATEA
jgi:hypothetical protein